VGGSPYHAAGGGINITPIFIIVSLVLNGILSGSIILRLLFFRWRIQKDLGPAAGRQYISIAAMLVESAMLYMAAWIPSLVPTFLQVPFQSVFTPASIYVQVCFSFCFQVLRLNHSDYCHFSHHLPSRIWQGLVQFRSGGYQRPTHCFFYRCQCWQSYTLCGGHAKGGRILFSCGCGRRGKSGQQCLRSSEHQSTHRPGEESGLVGISHFYDGVVVHASSAYLP
jgi:hypothetical protein